MSTDDEFVPSLVDMTSLCQRLATAMAVCSLGSTALVMSSGHSLRGGVVVGEDLRGRARWAISVAGLEEVHDIGDSAVSHVSSVIPLDGFYVPLEDLKSRPDAHGAAYRRGALDTFDPQGLYEKLKEVVDHAPKVRIPGFDHARGDPADDTLWFERNVHQIVLVEGLYLLQQESRLSIDPRVVITVTDADSRMNPK